MPNKVVFREVEELSGITLEDYLKAWKDVGVRDEDFKVEAGTGTVINAPEPNVDYLFESKRTLFSEVEAIDLILRIVDLVNETLHSREIVHTNLNP
jgi:hypothetical protein